MDLVISKSRLVQVKFDIVWQDVNWLFRGYIVKIICGYSNLHLTRIVNVNNKKNT